MPCEDLLYGRMSFKGFNPEIEVLFNCLLRIEALRNEDFSVHTPCCLAFAAPSLYRKTVISAKMPISAASEKQKPLTSLCWWLVRM